MIHIEVNMHGNLRRFLPDGVSSMQLALPDNTDIGQVIQRLRAQHDIWVASIDNEAVPLSTRLHDGASVDFFPHLEGG
ncbi:MoaD/ThiS family protein [Ferrovibrio sp.]|uniref:MoaD/ThiS family protein n=1 Tax=Ferrovibrio sp. TaxID=1917215 RepID=UPI0025BDFF15|nr:MoaD/ThiS family protein [Ferrovibrio sp.]MBX3453642.1 MoaD/ThiS family protein [Ferrovibrio sp.]